MAKKVIIIISVFAVVCGSLAFAFAPMSAKADESIPTYNYQSFAFSTSVLKSNFEPTSSSRFLKDSFIQSSLSQSLSVVPRIAYFYGDGVKYDNVNFQLGSFTSGGGRTDNLFNVDSYVGYYVPLFVDYIGLDNITVRYSAYCRFSDSYFDFSNIIQLQFSFIYSGLYPVYEGLFPDWKSMITGVGVTQSNAANSMNYVFIDKNGHSFELVFPFAGEPMGGHNITYYLTDTVNDDFVFGYNNGYVDGWKGGESAGYNNGYSVGKTDGTDIGYSSGYNDGLLAANNYSFLQLFTSVVQAPVDIFKSMFDFEILGFNLSHFLTALLSVGLIIAIVSRIKS